MMFKRLTQTLCATALAWVVVTAGEVVKSPVQALDGTQQQMLRVVNERINELTNLRGDFVQIGPNGERSEGVFYIEKPGRMRFDYADPNPLLVVANGRWVGISDMRERTTERYPLRTTPLKLILGEDIDLDEDAIVRDVTFEDDLVTVVMEERSGESIGQLALMFDVIDFDLRQWVVTDAQGLQTSVALYNTVSGQKTDRMKFVIPDYDRIDTGGN